MYESRFRGYSTEKAGLFDSQLYSNSVDKSCDSFRVENLGIDFRKATSATKCLLFEPRRVERRLTSEQSSFQRRRCIRRKRGGEAPVYKKRDRMSRTEYAVSCRRRP